ncbi:MAG: hypothetical protein CMJ83_08440 [Planctomycetes bacterium]|nr:hypothetical protein [Planctomycetota bacterium]
MASWLDRLKKSPLEWLRDKACPPVLHRTLSEVYGRPADDPEVAQARNGAFNYKNAVTISRSQQETGTWLDKILEFEAPNNSRHRGPGMVNQFLSLVEYGWDETHPIIHCSADRLLRYAMQDKTADLFELKGYAGTNEESTAMILHGLSVMSAACLSRAGYGDNPAVVAVAEQVLADLETQYPEGGEPDLYDGTIEIAEESKEDGIYRVIRPGHHSPDMFLFYLMAWHPVFHTDAGRAAAGRITEFMLKGDEYPLRLREVSGKRWIKLVDLHVAQWSQEEFADKKLGFLLHDLELLARTGSLVRSEKCVQLLDWLISLQDDDGVFRVDDHIEKVVSRSQYHYFPLEESWRGKHKKYTDVTFRVLLILKILDDNCPL